MVTEIMMSYDEWIWIEQSLPKDLFCMMETFSSNDALVNAMIHKHLCNKPCNELSPNKNYSIEIESPSSSLVHPAPLSSSVEWLVYVVVPFWLSTDTL